MNFNYYFSRHLSLFFYIVWLLILYRADIFVPDQFRLPLSSDCGYLYLFILRQKQLLINLIIGLIIPFYPLLLPILLSHSHLFGNYQHLWILIFPLIRHRFCIVQVLPLVLWCIDLTSCCVRNNNWSPSTVIYVCFRKAKKNRNYTLSYLR